MGSRVLIIGGTGFIGRYLVHACLTLDHEVTLLNRDHRPGPRAHDVVRLVGDRRDPGPDLLTALAVGWDAVIDTCASSADDMLLARQIPTRRYLLLSTCGVYRGVGVVRVPNEDAPVDPEGPERGNLACERVAADLPGTALTVRLGAVTGPGDPSGRLAYWIQRCLHGGDLLVPAEPGQPVQLADVREVAGFLAVHVASDLRGVVNVAGPATRFEDLLTMVMTATGSGARPRWVPEATVLDHGVRPWRDVPLWLPAGHPYRAHMRTGARRALQAGFTPRPLATTVADTVRWYRANRHWHPDWLPVDREQSILTRIG